MARTAALPRVLDKLSGTLGATTLTDSELLERFIDSHDEDAFATLVRRHGPMVLAACRRVLDPHTAEDAFQATFLILMKKAARIGRRELLGNWLYGVAYRVARKAKMTATRWQQRHGSGPDELFAKAIEEQWTDLRPVLDEELSGLSEKYRQLIVLCYLQGLTYDEVARRLGCPPGTVSGRLARARVLLRERLLRRGVVLSASVLSTMLASQAAAAQVSPLLLRTTLKAVRDTATVSSSILALTEGVLHTMKSSTPKFLSLVLLVPLLGAGSMLLRAEPGPVAPSVALARVDPPGASSLDKKGLPESVWTDLAHSDNVRVTRSILALGGAGPKDAVAFLGERLQPVKVDEARVQQLLGDLDSQEFTQRERAVLELEYLGKFIKPQLEKALGNAGSAEQRTRIEQLLKKLPKEDKKQPVNPGKNVSSKSTIDGEVIVSGTIKKLTVNGEEMSMLPAVTATSMLWVRAVRAIAVLEQIDTPEARKVLERLATGEADAWPTKEAAAALERLRLKR